MRNISFFLTKEQFKNQTKFVTRRNAWERLAQGDWLMGVEKGQGVKKGELKRLGPIEVLSISREPLNRICKVDCVLEGFPDLSPREFIHDVYLAGNRGMKETDLVTRIMYGYLEWIPSEVHYDVTGKRYVRSKGMGFIEKDSIHDPLVSGWDWIPDTPSRPSYLAFNWASVSKGGAGMAELIHANCSKDDIELWASKYMINEK